MTRQTYLNGLKASCGDCAFRSDAVRDGYTNCKRRAPIGREAGDYFDGRWPGVSVHDWCGEHKPREEGA